MFSPVTVSLLQRQAGIPKGKRIFFFKPQTSAEEGMDAGQVKVTDAHLFTEIWSLRKEENAHNCAVKYSE